MFLAPKIIQNLKFVVTKPTSCRFLDIQVSIFCRVSVVLQNYLCNVFALLVKYIQY